MFYGLLTITLKSNIYFTCIQCEKLDVDFFKIQIF